MSSQAIGSLKVFLIQLGMRPNRTIAPASSVDYGTFTNFNGHTLAIDDEGNGWSRKGTVDLSPHFSRRTMEVEK